MTRIAKKFNAHLTEIRDAIDGADDLRSSNQKLYRKICKYYKHEGINFVGDSDTDYSLIINLLYEDFN